MTDLPPTYSARERDYDLAMAAYRAAEQLSWVAAVGIGALAGLVLQSTIGMASWLAFLAVGAITYWLLMRPYRRRKAAASEAWHQESFGHLAEDRK